MMASNAPLEDVPSMPPAFQAARNTVACARAISRREVRNHAAHTMPVYTARIGDSDSDRRMSSASPAPRRDGRWLQGRGTTEERWKCRRERQKNRQKVKC